MDYIHRPDIVHKQVSPVHHVLSSESFQAYLPNSELFQILFIQNWYLYYNALNS
jgi:hypothetical protein